MLSPLTSERSLRRFTAYDLEWIPGTLEVRLVGAYDLEKGYRYYTSVASFLNCELTSENRGRWFYAHAGGLADGQFILSALVDTIATCPDYIIDCCFSGSSAIIIKVRRGKNCWHFIDSYWLLRDRLASIGQWVGLEKTGPKEQWDPETPGITDAQAREYEGKIREWYATVNLGELISYNAIDCEILWQAINSMEQTLWNLGGQLQMTIASSAMNLFRRKFLKRSIQTDSYVNHCAQKAYIASRVEVFDRDLENGQYYDINSSFPFAMTKSCPGAFVASGRKFYEGDRFHSITRAIVRVPESWLPPLGYRHETGRIFFPMGRWEGWFTDIDLRLLMEQGGSIDKVYECLLFEPFLDLRDYSATIYEMRKRSDGFQKLALKYLLNSLYGKFAESDTKLGLSINPDFAPRGKATQLFPGAWLCERVIPIPHQAVPISAHITARARKTLFDFFTRIKDLYYCDTDGFATTDTIETSDELGGLKLEKTVDQGFFLAPKVYSLKGKTLKGKDWKEEEIYKAKGFSRLNADRFNRIVEGNSIEYERMARIRENFRKGSHRPVETLVSKRLRLSDFVPKRFTYPDGATRPWTLEELKEIK